jgi:histidinol dehydrogenase
MRIVDLRKENFLEDENLKRVKNRGFEFEEEYLNSVWNIIKDIKQNGKEAVFKYAKKFDKANLNEDTVLVKEEEIKEALEKVDKKVFEALKFAAERIKRFHEEEKEKSFFIEEDTGNILGQKVTPLEKVALYVPGGKALYPSSVLMNAIPAKVAGVKELIVITPVKEDGKVNEVVLAACYVAGVDRIYKVGGVHGVAAVALGVDPFPKVDKIVGPGNIYVALAKKLLYGIVDIDMIAGPSEILVIAKDEKYLDYIAADLLSQAEHDELAAAFFVTPNESLAYKVKEKVYEFANTLERKNIILKSLENWGYIFITKNIKDACIVANEIAPEHLEVLLDNPFEVLGYLKNAGAIFLGPYTCEALGDYVLGPNHVLPTGGSAKFYSPLGVYDFIKRSSIIFVTKEGFEKVKDPAITLASAESLTAHALSVKIRK